MRTIAVDEQDARPVRVVIAPSVVMDFGTVDFQPVLGARGIERLLEPLGPVANDVFIRNMGRLGAAIFPFFLLLAGFFRHARLVGGALCFVVSHDTGPLVSLSRKVTPAPFFRVSLGLA